MESRRIEEQLKEVKTTTDTLSQGKPMSDILKIVAISVLVYIAMHYISTWLQGRKERANDVVTIITKEKESDKITYGLLD